MLKVNKAALAASVIVGGLMQIVRAMAMQYAILMFTGVDVNILLILIMGMFAYTESIATNKAEESFIENAARHIAVTITLTLCAFFAVWLAS